MIRDHLHDGFHVAGPHDPADDPALISQLVGAALAGCRECQNDILAEAAGQPVVTASLVRLGCSALYEQWGRLPEAAHTEDDESIYSRPFRTLTRAGAMAAVYTVDGSTGSEAALAAMRAAAAQMSSYDRAVAIHTSLGLLILAGMNINVGLRSGPAPATL